MLRASSQQLREDVGLGAVMDDAVASGVAHGEQLSAFAAAVVARDVTAVRRTREALIAAAGVEAMVDAAGVISNFERMVRIADASGIGLGRFEAETAGLRESLGIEAFRRRARSAR